jgi:hypothetical protein
MIRVNLVDGKHRKKSNPPVDWVWHIGRAVLLFFLFVMVALIPKACRSYNQERADSFNKELKHWVCMYPDGTTALNGMAVIRFNERGQPFRLTWHDTGYLIPGATCWQPELKVQ